MTSTVEYGHNNDSWIPVVEEYYLINNPTANSSNLEALRKDLSYFEKLRRVGVTKRENLIKIS